MKIMIVKILMLLLCGVVVPAHSQHDGAGQKPLSPREVVKGKAGNSTMVIEYCRPSVRGRKIFGALVPYGEVWRTGANAATTFEIDKAIKVEGKDLPAGKYELFTIPGENQWTIIFQKYSNQWGSFSYKKENDVLRVNVKPEKLNSFIETFTIGVEKNLIGLKWENTRVVFKVKG